MNDPEHGPGRPTAQACHDAEEAGLNASAAPEQRWLDGWLLRTCAVKAKRSRCIYPLAPGRLALAERLERARAVYRAASLPLVIRLPTMLNEELLDPHGLPLDQALAAAGLARVDDTRVMLCTDLAGLLPGATGEHGLPPGARLDDVGPQAYAQLIGALRASPQSQRDAHARRLRLAPVPHRGMQLLDGHGELLACGQYAREAQRVGLYDVFVPPARRGQGLARRLCAALLAQAWAEGARLAYLQVEAHNAPARATYQRLGFVDGYRYHYRCDDPAAV
jgi:GNAT superfamily N-acetyltransferase